MSTGFVAFPTRWTSPLLLAALLSACSAGPRQPAPVEDRTFVRQSMASENKGAPVATSGAVTTPVANANAEVVVKPGHYMVQKGDTLTRIALDHGQAWRDLARWNNLGNPDLIEVGQVLRVAPPGAAVEASGVVVRPVGSTAPSTAASTASTAAAAATTAAAATAANTGAANGPGSKAAANNAAVGDELSLVWPANGTVVATFDEAKNKGIDIAGKAGDPVLAAADGQVVYAGAGLRGYGNLIIVKHNSTYLTAYAHNQKLLVKEDQKVRKGEKIAEMGSSDSDRVKLHFEVRRQGKPVDPSKFLATR